MTHQKRSSRSDDTETHLSTIKLQISRPMCQLNRKRITYLHDDAEKRSEPDPRPWNVEEN